MELEMTSGAAIAAVAAAASYAEPIIETLMAEV